MAEQITRNNIGEAFHELTKFHRNYMAPHVANEEREPQYKEYQNVKQYPLPAPSTKILTSAFEAMIHRRSIRNYSKDDLKMHHLSKILWVAQGITAKVKGAELRAVGSAGALHPLEIYIIVNNVGDMPQGLYHYNVRAHALDLLIQDNFSLGIMNACLGQEFISESAAVIAWTGVFGRATWRYNQRAYRYAYLECGHAMQNASVACQAMDVGCCEIGAFYDDEINLMLGLDTANESVISLMSLGMTKNTNIPITSETIPEKVKVEKYSE